ncbi:Beta-monoglucosyldiacylglycerol synthase [Acaryochloris thomasi RCC1774]|uniref:Beta-monoglucosyldiacylglycerol synthase n=1 Tax=Acaryochloris thomasi RCC1774 TaxID=1764569 RepID=A0A2W1K0F6_9CYAN|nr:cellulose synthase family protein [Acaryochloris thomasi]PZD73747.1 Beta-monoglucosyldiacylglycerol synthase [Acaryochloris thomasi RCC1774]
MSALSENIYKIYLGLLIIIGLYSLHKVSIVWRFYKYRDNVPQPQSYYSDWELPSVTIQLPIFNEINVVDRLLEAIAHIHYPREKLEIQVLDDSLDETQTLCRSKVEELQTRDLNIHYIHRHNRTGFKAGALEHGLQSASGELVMIFDADFVPAPDTLLKMVHYFSDPQLGMVQARWGHINRHYSRLTEVQSLMLDGHFVTEQTARNRSGCFFNFNGTAGIWRTEAIADAGGWQHNTVTEDLDLSYRAQLKGWRCIYLPEMIVPAELPMEMNSFKAQQFRWAKGASQVMKKLLLPILKSNAPLSVKGEAFLHLTNNFNYLLLMALLLLSLPYQIYLTQAPWQHGVFIHLPLFLITTLSVLCFYFVSTREQPLKLPLWKLVHNIVLLMSVGIGLSINQSLAVCAGLFGGGVDFIRTPKHGVVSRQESWKTKKYRAARNLLPYLELFMAVYLTITIGVALNNQHFLSIPFLALFWSGYVYVLALSISQRR